MKRTDADTGCRCAGAGAADGGRPDKRYLYVGVRPEFRVLAYVSPRTMAH